MNIANIKYFILPVLFFINILFLFAENTEQQDETNELKHIWSLDAGLAMTAIKNLGYGIGINYERKLTDFLSIKPGFGHMVCFSEMLVTTVNIQLFFNYYPLSNGMDKLYIGFGNGCDFMMYPGKSDMENDVAVFITPLLGWKWKALNFLMVEPYIGWKFYVSASNNNENIDNYLSKGFQWGISFKIFFTNRRNKSL